MSIYGNKNPIVYAFLKLPSNPNPVQDQDTLIEQSP